MAFKHYDVVRAASPSDLAKRITQKLKEGWQPYGSALISTAGYGAEFIQPVVSEGSISSPEEPCNRPTTSAPSVAPEYYYVIALAGQSNGMSYGEGLPLPDTFDSPDPRIKQLARRSTVTPGGAVCKYNDIIPADHCLHDVQDMSRLNHPKADLSRGSTEPWGRGCISPKNCCRLYRRMRAFCWFRAVVVVQRSPPEPMAHTVTRVVPRRIQPAGVWTSRCIRTLSVEQKQH